MLDMTWVRANVDTVETALRNRGSQFDLDRLRVLDEQRRAALREDVQEGLRIKSR